MEGKDHGAARESKPVLPPPMRGELLEDDEHSVTGVVQVAHQSAEALSKDVDAQHDKIAARTEALREKLSNSGPILLRKKR